jgi:hypothetical protein
MNQPERRSQNARSSRAMVIFAAISAIATGFIAWAYFSQLSIMKDQLTAAQSTLDFLKESQRIAQKPMLKMHLHEDPMMASTAAYIPTEEGGERWLLYNYVHNIGDNPALGFKYYHKLSTDSVIAIPADSEFVSRWADDLIFPSETILCGYDPLLRQVYLDTVKIGKRYYRHFIIQYADESGNRYGFQAVWEIKYEKTGEPLSFNPVSYRPVVIQ